MNYIVSPSFVFLLSVVGNLRMIVNVLTILFGATIFVSSVVAGVYWDVGVDYGEDDPDYKRYLSYKKVVKILIPCFIIVALISIFLPDKNTLIEMKVASLLTKENVELTIETIKETVDYVVDAISKIK